MAYATKLTWVGCPVEEMSEEARLLWDAMQEAKAAFESQIARDVPAPAGTVHTFAYKGGDVAFAFKPGKVRTTLADLMHPNPVSQLLKRA